MTNDVWNRVDDYLAQVLIAEDPVLDAALQRSDDAGLPQIQVSPMQGKFLMLLARAQRARAVLEIGTLGGYSTIWLGRGLPADGRLVTLELDPKHAAVARENLAHAGLSSIAEVRVGRASETLPSLLPGGPFDLIFIDADKTGYPDYLAWALRLSHPGTLIVADNVVRDGAVADASSTDPAVQAVRRYLELVASDRRLSATVLQTVGVKGYDGLSIALVL